MLLYNKFGFELRILQLDDGKDCFNLLSSSRLDRHREPEMYAKDRRVLKGEILKALTDKYYNPIGLFKHDNLIGLSFSSVSKDDGAPWLGYFYINKKYRNGKGFIVLINYLINHLYKGAIIQMGPSNDSLYKKLIRPLPKILEFSVFKPEVSDRLKKICRED